MDLRLTEWTLDDMLPDVSAALRTLIYTRWDLLLTGPALNPQALRDFPGCDNCQDKPYNVVAVEH